MADDLSLCEWAIAQAQDDPHAARSLALYALARAGGDREVESVCERALGVVARELSDPPAAVRHLRRAIAAADAGGLPRRAAEARMSLGLALFDSGRSEAALEELDQARRALTGRERTRADVQRALILQRLGSAEEALAVYRRAIPRLAAAGDALWEARARTNRGVLHAYHGSVAAAEADLARAELLYVELDETAAAAQVRHNRGFAAARAGDVPEALARFDEAEPVLRTLGVPGWISLIDRCELLLSVPLVEEALALAERIVDALERRAMAAALPEARLQLAHAQLLAGQPAAALSSAVAAEAELIGQRRHGWALVARHAQLVAALAAGERSAARIAFAQDTAEALDAGGWPELALDTRLAGAGLALELGRLDAVAGLVGAARPRSGQPAGVRVRAAHAQALARLAGGDRGGAARALRAAVRAGDAHRLALGATELRAHAGIAQTEAARLGLRLALQTGAPARVLEWSELERGGAVARRPVRPPADARLAAILAELRAVANERRDSGGRGLERRQAALEAALRSRARQARRSPVDVGEAPTLRELRERLEQRALVSWVELDGALHAVTVNARRARLFPLGDWPAAELEHLRFALARLAGPGGEAHLAAVAHAARRLDAAVLAPLAGELGDRELVLVPTAALRALPFAVLPSCAGRPLAVAPSARLWWTAAAGRRSGSTLLVAGPGLEHARAEISSLARVYPKAAVLTGAGATVARVLQALDGAGLAHVAAHGSFRRDHPLFSSLRLADGSLTGYDLETVRRPPGVVVLSACDGGLAGSADGLLGLAAALLPRGTATLVASLGPIGDSAARTLMEGFHTGLCAGRSPSAALAAAQQDAGPAGASFACLGAG